MSDTQPTQPVVPQTVVQQTATVPGHYEQQNKLSQNIRTLGPIIISSFIQFNVMCVMAMSLYYDDKNMRDNLTIAAIASVTAMIGYWLGSASDSSRKTELLAQSQPISTPSHGSTVIVTPNAQVQNIPPATTTTTETSQVETTTPATDDIPEATTTTTTTTTTAEPLNTGTKDPSTPQTPPTITRIN